MRKNLFVFLLSAIIVLSACSSKEEEVTRCKLPPKDFTEKDLVGTWVVQYLDLRRDTLVIKENGTYKQFIYLKAYAVDYESDWLPWRIEYFDDGIPYLHLEGMRLCAQAPDLRNCDQAGGGEKDWNAFNQGEWYDSCRNEWLIQNGEGILRVRGATDAVRAHNGIELAALTLNSIESWVYQYQEPDSNTPIPLP